MNCEVPSAYKISDLKIQLGYTKRKPMICREYMKAARVKLSFKNSSYIKIKTI